MTTNEFRGKNFDNGEWEYGYVVSGCNSREWHIGDFLVDANTIGQFTGLKTSNGEKIYEGDIIRFGKGFFEISFADGCFWMSNQDYTMELHTVLGMGKVEVVGNIHDNPELKVL